MDTFSRHLFESHILFELSHTEPNKISFLFEERSIVPGIDTILDRIMQMLSPQIYEAKRNIGAKISRRYQNINELGLKNLFFKTINFYVDTTIGNNTTYNGSFERPEVQYQGEDTKIDLVIDIFVEQKDEDSLRKTLYFAFGHEIVHAYDHYQWMMKHKRSYSPGEFQASTRYKNFISRPWDDNNTRVLKNMMYRLSRTERNAYIGQLRQELLPLRDEIVDATSALNAIKRTKSYKQNYEAFNNFLESLHTIQGDETKDGIETKNDIIQYTNKICLKYFTTFEQVVKYFEKRCEKYHKVYMIKASKIVGDIYQNNHFTIGGQEL